MVAGDFGARVRLRVPECQLHQRHNSRLAVSLEAQRQPHSIRRPGGRPRFALGFLQRRPRGQRLRSRFRLYRSARGWFGTEARISLALACRRINRRGTPRGIGAGELACAAVSAPRPRFAFDFPPRRSTSSSSLSVAWGIL
jgi:hypothetical protein